MTTEEREIWFKLKKEYLDSIINGFLYRSVKVGEGDYRSEPFDDGDKGVYSNILCLQIVWIFEGRQLVKKMRNSRKRKMKRMVETRLRKIGRKYGIR